MKSEALKPVALKPCPFCANSAHVHTEHDTDGFGVFLSVKCGHCRAQSGATFSSSPCPLTYQQVRDEWNRRPAPYPELVREIAERYRIMPDEILPANDSQLRALINQRIESAINEALGHEGVKG